MEEAAAQPVNETGNLEIQLLQPVLKVQIAPSAYWRDYAVANGNSIEILLANCDSSVRRRVCMLQRVFRLRF
jgi:hypothetical protein